MTGPVLSADTEGEDFYKYTSFVVVQTFDELVDSLPFVWFHTGKMSNDSKYVHKSPTIAAASLDGNPVGIEGT